MSGPVDVLAVMDSLIEEYEFEGEVVEARAAVAELIAANEAEYVAIKAYLRGAITQDEHKRATQRRRAALARVKGEEV